MNQDLSSVIEDGMKQGISRQQHYEEGLLKIKPEYLLTVSVADAIVGGFNGTSGIDFEIRLKAKASRVLQDIEVSDLGNWKSIVQASKAGYSFARSKEFSNGKVDIYANCTTLRRKE